VSRSTTTAADGGYVFTQLDPGRYKLEVSAQGFKTAVREHVQIAVGITSNLDIRLTVGAVTETVTVEAEITGVNTTDASLGNVISGSQVLDLPSVNLDPSGLLSLQPGVTFIPGQADIAGGYSGTNDLDGRGGSVNGARSDQTNITLDGVDVNDPQNGYAFTSVLRATQASLQEFRVTTTNYNADLGRSSGAEVQLVTKSGTNDIHGMGYYAHRNEIFNANDFFLNRSGVERGKFRRHIYGLALGGPIVKDRFFLFGNWEVLREDLNESIERDVPSATFRDGVMVYECDVPASCPGGTVNGFMNTHTIPAGFYGLTTAEMTAIDPAGIGPSTAASSYFNLFPMPNSTGSFDGINVLGFRFNSPVSNRFHTYILKADYNIDRNGSHKVYWRGTLQNDAVTAAGPQFPGLPANQIRASYNKGFSLGYSALITPNWVNSFRLGYTRISEATQGNQSTEYVNFRFLSNLEDFASDTFGRILPLWDIRDDVSWTYGTHTFSFGGSLRFVRNSKFNNANSFQFFTGNPSWLPNVGDNIQPGNSACMQAGCTAVPAVSSGFAAGYNDAAVMLLGIITQATASYNFDRTGATLPGGEPVARRFATNEFEFYFQDQWRLNPSLTITAGLRYSLFSPPWETNGNQVQPVLIGGGAQPGDGLGEWLEIRRQLMLAGLPTNNAPQIGYALGGPANDAPHFYNWDKNNWSPRAAVAWAPHYREGILGTIFGDGKLSIRAGYSLVYDRVGSALVNSFDNSGAFGMSTQIDSLFGGCGEGPSTAGPLGVCPRFAGTFEFGAPTVAVPGGLAITNLLPPSPGGTFPAIPPGADSMGVLAPGAFAIAVALDNTLRTPYAHTINFSIARQLPWDLTVETAYVGRSGRNGLIIRDMAMPADLVDPASGMTYFQATQQLLALGDAGQDINTLAPIPYWENLFPSWGPLGVNGGFLDCDFQNVSNNFAIGGYSATQVAYDLLNCEHPDTTVVPWLIDLFPYPGYMLGGAGAPDIDGDGFPDAPFAYFDDQFATLTAWSSTAHSEYHAFQLTVRKRMSHGIAFDLNYTLAKSLDMASQPERTDLFGGFALGAGYTGSTINTWQPNLEYSFSDYDMRHQFNANWTMEIPFGRGRAVGRDMPAWLDQIIGGWQIAGIVRINSRLPATVINARRWPTNWNLQGNATCGPRSTWTGVAACPSTSNAHGAIHGGDPTTASPNLFSDPDAAFDGFRFTLPGQRGERNIIRGDKFFNLDLAVAKTFKMPWEGHSLKMRWETFNVTNSVYFDTAYLSASIGRKGTFGDYTGVLGGPRKMQITFRYEF
jgi:hypothetical protein